MKSDYLIMNGFNQTSGINPGWETPLVERNYCTKKRTPICWCTISFPSFYQDHSVLTHYLDFIEMSIKNNKTLVNNIPKCLFGGKKIAHELDI